MSNAATVDRVVIGVFATYKTPEDPPRVLTARRGASITVTEAEAKRLDGLGTVATLDLAGLADHERQAKLDRYRAERGDAEAVEAVARAVAPTDPIPDVTVPQPSVSPPGLGAAPVGTIVTGDTGGPDTPPPPEAATSAALPRADAPDIAEAPVAEIAAWISAESPNIGDTVVLAENDPALASKLLEAEQSATGGDPRKGVEDGLQKIIDSGE